MGMVKLIMGLCINLGSLTLGHWKKDSRPTGTVGTTTRPDLTSAFVIQKVKEVILGLLRYDKISFSEHNALGMNSCRL